MDLLTQGILGASTAQAGAKRGEFRIASITGFIAGLLPDLDTLIRSQDNPLLVLEYHRHFTHSFIFIPVGALLVSAMIWLIYRKKYSFKSLYWYSLLGICLAGILDACTSYGTSLLWPISNDKIAWNLIAIVDPIFSFILLIPLIIGLKKRSHIFTRAGLTLALMYLLLAWGQSQRAEEIAMNLIADRSHSAIKQIIKPTMGNIVLWKSIYIHDEKIYTDAIRVGMFGSNKIYTGSNLPLLNSQGDNPFVDDSQAGRDFLRFAAISDHWLGVHPSRPDMAGDVRYTMLPISTEPLWGVNLEINDQYQHLDVITNRRFTPFMRQQFINMLLGRDLEQ